MSDKIERNLEACARDLLELEIKHGMDYETLMDRLEAGELGDEFMYPLEEDILRWSDLIAEKKH